MWNAKFLQSFSKQFSESLPPAFKEFRGEIEAQLESALQNLFAKMHLVTREEFDTQTRVLLQTQQKLELLEEKLKTLMPLANE